VAGTDEGKAAAVIGDTVRALCLLAQKLGYAIAVESLDFARKKAGLREVGKAHARRLSGFAYSRLHAILSARCARDGVGFVEVDPAFTSVIGRVKYARCRAMSPHHAAALVIGRAAMGYGERLVRQDGTALDAPGRMRPRNERRRWRGVRRPGQEGAKAPVRTARSGTGTALKGGRQRPAPAVAGQGRIPSRTGRGRTGRVPDQVGGAVAPAIADTVS
jgi:IS605 OrfB family transposase